MINITMIFRLILLLLELIVHRLLTYFDMEIALAITFALLFIIIFLLNYWINSNFTYWKNRGIPHLTTTPLRFLYEFVIKRKAILEIIKDDYNLLNGERFGGYFSIMTPSVMIRDPELVQNICVKDFMYFTDRNQPLGKGDLFTQVLQSLTGERWKILRYKLAQTFASGKIKMMFKPIKESCDEAVEYLNMTGDQEVDARDFTFKFVINSIGNLLFGIKVDAFNEATAKDNEFLQVIISFNEPTVWFILRFIIAVTFPRIRKVINISIVNKKTDIFFRKLVKDMIELREKTNIQRNDFLQLMLEQKKKEELELHSGKEETKTKQGSNDLEESEDREILENIIHSLRSGQEKDINETKVFTDDCIISNAFAFVTAGTEITSSVLTFVLYELANNPGLQKRVQEELAIVLSKSQLNYNTIFNSLKYMEQFINETIRIHQPAPFLMRVCTQDYTIPGSNVVIEKGTTINIPIIGLHNDPQYFPDPEKFDPDRFVDMDSIPKGVFTSFGSGPRMCIAKRLSIMKIKIFLATILQNFKVTLGKKMKLPLKKVRTTHLQRVEGGMWIKFEPL